MQNADLRNVLSIRNPNSAIGNRKGRGVRPTMPLRQFLLCCEGPGNCRYYAEDASSREHPKQAPVKTVMRARCHWTALVINV